ncbi:hypothetical protein QFC19_004020 [Naganishia cerealis]|uniref:Uncharacterized protein n=1 Tax=Naganishia cerealis TaxID=610337 RepID=A0ACC2VYD4_9TREE|nr:hypothetical protein QFC19_004020 [Naganishia cerealis]
MATTLVNNHPINGHSIWTIIVFFLVNILVVFPLKIPIPYFISKTGKRLLVSCRILSDHTGAPRISSERKASPEGDRNGADGSATPAATLVNDEYASEERAHFTLGLATAPVIGVLLLLATTSIGGQVLRNGIVGVQGVKPYDIMTLFISLAYISISLDCTGLLRFLAFWVALKGGTSGRKLYLYFYLFFFVFGVVVGNDPIILSGTSFLAYFSRIAGISPPRAWTFAQFAASNVASAVLVSSNPTNLVLTGAYDISFLVYSAWLVLPVLATSLVLLPLLMFGVFNDEELVPRRLETPDVNPKTALIDKNGAIFGSTLLAITLVALVTLSAVNLLHGVQGVWTVTAPAAILMLLRDIWHDLYNVGFQERRSTLKAQGSGDLDGRQRRTESGERISIDGSPRQGEVIEMTNTSMENRRPASLIQRFSTIKPPLPQSSSATPASPSSSAQQLNAPKPSTASASLLWKQILAQKSILVGRIEFAKYNAIPVFVCMIVGSLVIAGEVCIMYKS